AFHHGIAPGLVSGGAKSPPASYRSAGYPGHGAHRQQTQGEEQQGRWLRNPLGLPVEEIVHHYEVDGRALVRSESGRSGSAGARATLRKETVCFPRNVSTGSRPVAPVVVLKARDVPGRLTSENTTPNPLTPAGTVPPVPGMEKTPSVILLPSGVNRRFGLKGAKSAVYWILIWSRLSWPPVAAAWVRPVPGVVNV